jgi:hypothetical protein
MQKFVTDLDLNELKKMYEEKGLTKKEIDPAIERAKLVKKHVAKMSPDKIIGPDEWAISKAVEDYCNADNFYARRHADYDKDYGVPKRATCTSAPGRG